MVIGTTGARAMQAVHWLPVSEVVISSFCMNVHSTATTVIRIGIDRVFRAPGTGSVSPDLPAGLIVPRATVFGYLVIAILLILPTGLLRRGRT